MVVAGIRPLNVSTVWGCIGGFGAVREIGTAASKKDLFWTGNAKMKGETHLYWLCTLVGSKFPFAKSQIMMPVFYVLTLCLLIIYLYPPSDPYWPHVTKTEGCHFTLFVLIWFYIRGPFTTTTTSASTVVVVVRVLWAGRLLMVSTTHPSRTAGSCVGKRWANWFSECLSDSISNHVSLLPDGRSLNLQRDP